MNPVRIAFTESNEPQFFQAVFAFLWYFGTFGGYSAGNFHTFDLVQLLSEVSPGSYVEVCLTVDLTFSVGYTWSASAVCTGNGVCLEMRHF